MLDHMTFRVSDLAKTESFYTPTLEALGYRLDHRFEVGDNKMIGYSCAAPDGSGRQITDTWFIQGPSPHNGHPITTGCHLCWSAASRTQVDAFYKAAMQSGGRDNGPPGLREHYHPHYYGAFVTDPDGNNVEACCHVG